MDNKDFVTYETAKRLKECGFNEPCDHYYCAFDNETDVQFWDSHPAYDYNSYNEAKKVIASAPTLHHAQKWLRE